MQMFTFSSAKKAMQNNHSCNCMMKVNHKTKDDQASTLEFSLRGEGRCNSSISNLDEFELTKDKTRFE